ncbi:MAG: hypothetical protein LBD80_07670, partial [Tannerella sp.]|nr:hypothetical protein [Tannerella sp.]
EAIQENAMTWYLYSWIASFLAMTDMYIIYVREFSYVCDAEDILTYVRKVLVQVHKVLVEVHKVLVEVHKVLVEVHKVLVEVHKNDSVFCG